MERKVCKSVVKVYFPGKNKSLDYFNDSFDLHIGDMVYVDGKMEAHIGRVTAVNYSFKIKLSAYKKVTALVDTRLEGRFYITDSHMISFDPAALPREKVSLWFNAPEKEDSGFAIGEGDSKEFSLEDLKGFEIALEVAERGIEYYNENRVSYISLDKGKGFAIVQGSKNYELEFCYDDGNISGLICPCYCSYNCKHMLAAMLELRETMKAINRDYREEYERSGYFAAVSKTVFLNYGLLCKNKGCISLSPLD